jgi:hypothetical protein
VNGLLRKCGSKPCGMVSVVIGGLPINADEPLKPNCVALAPPTKF